MADIAIGDLILLRSGSPLLVVYDCDTEFVYVRYFSETQGGIQEHRLKRSDVVLVAKNVT